MPPALLIMLLTVTFATGILQFLVWRRLEKPGAAPPDVSSLHTQLEVLQAALESSTSGIRDEFSRLRQEHTANTEVPRENGAAPTDAITDVLQHQFSENEQRLERLRQAVDQRLDALSGGIDVKVDLLRTGVGESGARLQGQVTQTLERLQATLNQAAQQSRTSAATLANAQKLQLDEIRAMVENRLAKMSADNEKRLEQMRATVEEKLQSTLETRLGASFNLVSERLEQVQKGLGEMQTLASGVGDLRRVLTNVKTRGAWGEVQLGNLLEQMLAPTQYAKNVDTAGNQERVEFAIKLPGQETGEICWLPIDAKFPVEDYQRLLDASEAGDNDAIEVAARNLEATLGLYAKAISEKYLRPPLTTDFGILFLATEGLYAEALRRPGLVETMQREYRIVITGPTTFAAILNSLQMGFRTLAIQQRSTEVWKTLSAVKTEFARYASVISQVKKKLEQATKAVDGVEVRTRALGRELRAVRNASNERDESDKDLLGLALAAEDEEILVPESRLT